MLHLQVIRLCKICIPPVTVNYREQIISQLNQRSQSSSSELTQKKFICNHFRYLFDLQNLNVMETENQNVQLVEYALQYYDLKKYDTTSMLSVLYKYASKKLPHTFLMIELCLSAPYSNEFVKKILRHCYAQREDPEIEQFIKVLVMQQWFGRMQWNKGKEGNGKQKKI